MIDPQSGASIGNWLLTGAAIVAIANQGLGMIDRLKGRPSAESLQQQAQELKQASLVAQQAADDRMDKFEEELGGLRQQMRNDRNDILNAGEERATKLHDRINNVLAAVSHVQGALTRMSGAHEPRHHRE